MDSNKIWIIIIAAVVLLCLCLCGALLVTGVITFNLIDRASENPSNPSEYVLVTPPARPTPAATRTDPAPELPRATPLPPAEGAYETLYQLQQALVPNNDPRDLALRLEGKQDIPETVPFPGLFRVGDRKKFWVSDVDTSENFQAEMILRYITDSAYFWIEDGVTYSESALRRLGDTFNDQIYPTNRDFFGSEWSPGIDNDPRLYILYVRGVGNNIAGYFSSADSVHPLAHRYSNAHEMFILSADNTGLSQDFTYGVLAHEFQHMIHWYRDRNEETWLNEGFSELAALLNGYDPGGFDYVFSLDPDLQLNDWPNDSGATTPHYGASFLFLAYFLDRFGEDASKALVAHPDNGLDSIDAVLAEMNVFDPVSGAPVQADDFFSEWTVTNYLNDSTVGDGRYAYQRYTQAPRVFDTQTTSTCDGRWSSSTVNQYGTDYIRFDCPFDFDIQFQGMSEVGVLPQDAYSGKYAFWSNKGDESDMTLTQTFDFRRVSGPLSLEYRTWYDLEEDYDYLYLVASSDRGATWEIIETPSCTTYDPSGNSYGCGYNGKTRGYIFETVDLSRFAGQEVTLRFEYVTDAAVNGEGLLLDDIAIPAIGYFSDFEQDDGGWEAAGFVRIQNRLPQTYRLALITLGSQVTVEHFEAAPGQALSLPVNLRGSGDSAVLVVSGTTRFTRQEAGYRFSAGPK